LPEGNTFQRQQGHSTCPKIAGTAKGVFCKKELSPSPRKKVFPLNFQGSFRERVGPTFSSKGNSISKKGHPPRTPRARRGEDGSPKEAFEKGGHLWPPLSEESGNFQEISK